ncbi:DUF1772 domain-containing protein [Flavobacterium rakeshii]|uniref:anthrone oxygenase family protein n=1 Tax=Flavobacterium rakeshii TaxID=1038845 RepID=UPI002E7B1F81|nr:DUF1772 domain-containing protein [Flavobacterium rakeshii]MEE1896931.1 DUF1772 domain-containing protein [Flavobacterium rakeshii]
MNTFASIIHILTLLSTALMAGLFFSYSFSVNSGLGQLNDSAYLLAMQSINRAILNPVFFMCFFGTVILLPLNAYLQYDGRLTINFSLYGLSAAFYVIGLFGITILGNVPLNDTLEAFDLGNASQETISGMRETFEGPWNKWHNIRTTAVVISFLLLSIASVLPKK